jgi:hypothetical protein
MAQEGFVNPSVTRLSIHGVLHALAFNLRKVISSDKFKLRLMDNRDGSSNPKEFIKVCQMVIKAAGGDDWVKANYLPTSLSRAVAQSWLINLPNPLWWRH